jgi:hypothetical protein
VTNPKTQTKTKGEVTLNIRQGYVFSFEDAINLQPRSRLEIILTTLDFDDVITTLSKENEQHRGPTGYLVEHKFKALIAMRVYNMATFTELVERLTHDPVLRYNCGFDVFGKVPSIATFSRFYEQLTQSEVLGELFKKQVKTAESMGEYFGLTVQEHFGFTWCECNPCPDCCLYVVEIVDVDAKKVKSVSLTNVGINVIATSAVPGCC